MEVVLAIDHVELEDYIEGLPNTEVIDRLSDSLSITSVCEENNPDIVILSDKVTGANSIRIVKELNSSKFFTGRVIFLYTTLDYDIHKIIKYCVEREYRDYLVGDIDNTELNALLVAPRSKKQEEVYWTWCKKHFNFKEQKKERVIEKTVYVEEKMTIAIYSGCSTGKSFLAWALSIALANAGKRVGILGLDRANNLKVAFDVEEVYDSRISSLIDRQLYSQAVNECFRTQQNIGIINVPDTEIVTLDQDTLGSLITAMKNDNDILIIDCNSDDIETVKTVLSLSTKDIVVFDLDVSHFNSNIEFISKLDVRFNPSKSVALINKAIKTSVSFKETLKNIKRLGADFADYCYIDNLLSEPTDLILVEHSYKDFSDKLKSGTDDLMVALKCKKEDKKAGLFGFFKNR